MHGIVKTKTDEAQKAVEKKKKEKKIALYVTARDVIFDKMRKNQYDEDGLTITSNILVKNPDIYTFWNYRKKNITKLNYRQPLRNGCIN